MNLPKHIHIIGISGVATSALAIAFKKAGMKVTGSDKGFFPPVSTELEKAGIAFYAGWHPEKMVVEGMPDLVMIGGSGTSPSNPETLHAKEHGIRAYSYAQLIGKFIVKPNSIVCAGTWGKTSSAALLAYILKTAGRDPSYMYGGISLSGEPSAALSSGDWDVLEGDEYQAGISDKQAKFFYYNPTHLLLTAVSWDHADLYPTEESYFDAFKKLILGIPSSGLIVANADQPGIKKVLMQPKTKIIWYGKGGPNANADYIYSSVKQSEHGLSFTINHNNESWSIKSPLLGIFQAENITGCFALAHSIGIEPQEIIVSIALFKGLRRRLEKRLNDTTSNRGITVFDDIAHSPEKASSVLKELHNIYRGKIIAVFEPNIGGRERDAATKYNNAFKDADMVVIPHLTKLKINIDTKSGDSTQPMEGGELAKIISKMHTNIHYFENDTTLVDFLISNTKKGDIIAFLGSHGFRGMIEETMNRLGQ